MLMKMNTKLSGERIVIRNYEPSDLEFVTGMWLDEENGAYMSDPTPEHVDAAFQHALDSLQDSPFGYYLIIELVKTGERVGSFSIFPDEDRKVYDIGYCIHKTHWRKGYAGEALALMLEWVKSRGAGKVTAEVAVENAASNALLHKFGFAVEKKAQFRKYNMDICFDSFIYAKEL